MNRCDAHHDGHDCRTTGACSRGLLALLERVDNRSREDERQRDLARTFVVWPDNPIWGK